MDQGYGPVVESLDRHVDVRRVRRLEVGVLVPVNVHVPRRDVRQRQMRPDQPLRPRMAYGIPMTESGDTIEMPSKARDQTFNPRGKCGRRIDTANTGSYDRETSLSRPQSQSRYLVVARIVHVGKVRNRLRGVI